MGKKSPYNSKNKPSDSQYIRYSSLGFQLIATIAIGMFIGVKLDDWLEMEKPIFTVCVSVFFVIIALYIVVKDLLKEQ